MPGSLNRKMMIRPATTNCQFVPTEFLLIQVYLTSGTLISLLLWLYRF